MPKITDKGGPSFDPQQPVDPGEAADPRSPVPDPNAPRERPGEDGTGFAKHQDISEAETELDGDVNTVEYEGRSLEYEWPERPASHAAKSEWVAFADKVNQIVTVHLEEDPPIKVPADASKAALVEAYRGYGDQPEA